MTRGADETSLIEALGVCLGLLAMANVGCGPLIKRVSKPVRGSMVLDHDCGGVPSAINEDGRYVVFMSRADRLTSFYVDRNGNNADVFRRDMADRETELASITPSPARDSGNDHSGTDNVTAVGRLRVLSISDDGSSVVFSSYASDLVSPSPAFQFNLYVRNFGSGTTLAVPMPMRAAEGGVWGAISGDGRYVAFQAPDHDSGFHQIYRWKIGTDEIALVSQNASGEVGSAASSSPSISRNGRYVAFQSESTNFGSPSGRGISQVYVKDISTARGPVSLCSFDASDPGRGGNDHSEYPSISADGSLVAFQSTATDLTSSGGTGTSNIFLCNPWGQPKTVLMVSRTYNQDQPDGDSNRPMLCANGGFVVFDSAATNLTDGDENLATRDVYRVRVRKNVHDDEAAATYTIGAPEMVSRKRDLVIPISSDGLSTDAPSLAGACSADGGKVVFETSEQMLTRGRDRDEDQHVDIYLRDFDDEF